MTVKINEIFYSIQGEGFHTGTPAVFVRFSGCNLKCPFCDTNHQDGEEYSIEEIIDKIQSYACKFIVITGGEPSLQLTEAFVDKLHQLGYYIAVETNGTKDLPKVDWITCSPKGDWVKQGSEVVKRHYNEVKVVNDGSNDVNQWLSISADHYFLQPCDTGNKEKNLAIIHDTIAKCLANPLWRISLQTHKILNVR